jgi:hypothetical protein
MARKRTTTATENFRDEGPAEEQRYLGELRCTLVDLIHLRTRLQGVPCFKSTAQIRAIEDEMLRDIAGLTVE